MTLTSHDEICTWQFMSLTSISGVQTAQIFFITMFQSIHNKYSYEALYNRSFFSFFHSSLYFSNTTPDVQFNVARMSRLRSQQTPSQCSELTLPEGVIL